MPPTRLATLIALVLVAAALTVSVAMLAAPSGLTAGWALLPLLAVAASVFWRKRS